MALSDTLALLAKDKSASKNERAIAEMLLAKLKDAPKASANDYSDCLLNIGGCHNEQMQKASIISLIARQYGCVTYMDSNDGIYVCGNANAAKAIEWAVSSIEGACADDFKYAMAAYRTYLDACNKDVGIVMDAKQVMRALYDKYEVKHTYSAMPKVDGRKLSRAKRAIHNLKK